MKKLIIQEGDIVRDATYGMGKVVYNYGFSVLVEFNKTNPHLSGTMNNLLYCPASKITFLFRKVKNG